MSQLRLIGHVFSEPEGKNNLAGTQWSHVGKQLERACREHKRNQSTYSC